MLDFRPQLPSLHLQSELRSDSPQPPRVYHPRSDLLRPGQWNYRIMWAQLRCVHLKYDLHDLLGYLYSRYRRGMYLLTFIPDQHLSPNLLKLFSNSARVQHMPDYNHNIMFSMS
jgi:hypothetical protein